MAPDQVETSPVQAEVSMAAVEVAPEATTEVVPSVTAPTVLPEAITPQAPAVPVNPTNALRDALAAKIASAETRLTELKADFASLVAVEQGILSHDVDTIKSFVATVTKYL